jgi:S-adenosylmethionine synthetase
MIRPKGKYLFTSESVTEGHPDKVADKISDSVLDAILAQDPDAHVACETLVTTGMAFIAGEISTKAYADLPQIVRETVKDIGYTSSEMGFDAETCAVISSIDKQSVDIAQGVSRQKPEEQGAGDQGMMFGFATTETDALMPMPIYLAHKLSRRLTYVRKEGILDFLRPDGKTQVAVRYVDGKPVAIDKILISTQHADGVDIDALMRPDFIEHIIDPVLALEGIDYKGADVLVNPTGRFVIGGPDGRFAASPAARSSWTLTAAWGAHGGGAFSGKDPSKVDRSGAYMARYVAKNVVAAGLAEVAEVQIAYAIGMAEPVSVLCTSHGTGPVSDDVLTKAVREVFDLRPYYIIQRLNLKRPIYRETTNYGHFGRERPEFIWEQTDAAADLRTACKL